MMAAFMLTLDFTVPVFHLLSILFLLAIFLNKNLNTPIDKFHSVLRSVCKVE